eukprot:gene11657-5657_t
MSASSTPASLRDAAPCCIPAPGTALPLAAALRNTRDQPFDHLRGRRTRASPPAAGDRRAAPSRLPDWKSGPGWKRGGPAGRAGPTAIPGHAPGALRPLATVPGEGAREGAARSAYGRSARLGGARGRQRGRGAEHAGPHCERTKVDGPPRRAAAAEEPPIRCWNDKAGRGARPLHGAGLRRAAAGGDRRGARRA